MRSWGYHAVEGHLFVHIGTRGCLDNWNVWICIIWMQSILHLTHSKNSMTIIVLGAWITEVEMSDFLLYIICTWWTNGARNFHWCSHKANQIGRMAFMHALIQAAFVCAFLLWMVADFMLQTFVWLFTVDQWKSSLESAGKGQGSSTQWWWAMCELSNNIHITALFLASSLTHQA